MLQMTFGPSTSKLVPRAVAYVRAHAESLRARTVLQHSGDDDVGSVGWHSLNSCLYA